MKPMHNPVFFEGRDFGFHKVHFLQAQYINFVYPKEIKQGGPFNLEFNPLPFQETHMIVDMVRY